MSSKIDDEDMAADLKKKLLSEIDQGIYRCFRCEIAPMSMQDIRRHYREEHPHLKQECSICFNKYSRQDDVEDHLTEFHGKDKKPDIVWVCVHCEEAQKGRYVFNKAAKLKGHNDTLHHNWTHECSCGNVFESKAVMKKHCR